MTDQAPRTPAENAKLRRERYAQSEKGKARRKQHRTENSEKVSQQKKQSYEKNKDHYLAKSKEWVEKNPEESKKIKREWHTRNKITQNARNKHFYHFGGGAEILRALHLRRAYNLTPTEYDQLLEEQSGYCKICGGVNKQGNTTRLHVDHCHKTGKVRGLLCFKCNTGLGRFNDDLELLERAILYLKENS